MANINLSSKSILHNLTNRFTYGLTNSHATYLTNLTNLSLALIFLITLILTNLISTLPYIPKANADNTGITKIGQIGGYESPPLDYPQGVAVSNSGNIYVAEYYNNRIQIFNSSGVYQSQFGTYGTGNGQFNNPRGIALDTAGNIYVADTGNNRIQIFDSNGTYQSQLIDVHLNSPTNIAVSNNVIYVLEEYANEIRLFNSSDGYISQFGAEGCLFLYEMIDGSFCEPVALDVDESGNIYVADTGNNRIQIFNSSGVYQSQFGTEGSGDGQFNSPGGIALDSAGNIYVVDSNNNRIQIFNSSGVYQSQFGTYGTGNGQFNNPRGIALDTAGNIYVVDSNNNRIQKFDSSGQFITIIPDIDSSDTFFTYSPAILQGKLYATNVNFDSGGFNGVYVFSESGVKLQYFENPQDDGLLGGHIVLGAQASADNIYLFSAYDNGFAFHRYDPNRNQIIASYSTNTSAYGMTVSSDNYIYIPDHVNQQIMKYSGLTGELETTFGQPGSAQGELSLFAGPSSGLGVDAGGNLWVADSGNNRIQKFDSNGQFLQSINVGLENGDTMIGLAAAPDGGVYVEVSVGDYGGLSYVNELQKYNASGEKVSSYTPPENEVSHLMLTPGSNGRIYASNIVSQGIDVYCDHSVSNNGCVLGAEDNDIPTTDGMMIIPNKVDGKSIAMSAPTGSTLANLIAIGTNNIPKDNQDQNYSYPMGLASFSLTDVGTGGTVTPSIFFETDLEPADVVVRKYYPEDGLYINLPNATVTKYTVANMKGLMVTYPITDGGELDLDNLANGSIIDPIGLATVTNPSLLNTGFKVVFPIILAIIIVSLGITTYLDYRKHKQPLLDMDKEMNTNIAKQYTYWHHMKVVTIPLAKYRISVRLERQDSVDDNAVEDLDAVVACIGDVDVATLVYI